MSGLYELLSDHIGMLVDAQGICVVSSELIRSTLLGGSAIVAAFQIGWHLAGVQAG